MVSFRRHSVAKNSWKVSGNSQSSGKGPSSEDRSFRRFRAASSRAPGGRSDRGPTAPGGGSRSPSSEVALLAYPAHDRGQHLRPPPPGGHRGVLEAGGQAGRGGAGQGD